MTLAPRLIPQAGAALWTAAMLGPVDWMLPVGAEAATELALALDALGGRRPQRAEDVPLPGLSVLLRQVVDRLEHGRGLALLRGLPLEILGEDVLLALAAHLGQVLPQDVQGGLVASLDGPAATAEMPLRFHADPADLVVLLCRQQATQGGSVTLASAAAIHNTLMKQDRAALACLYEGLPQRGPRGDAITLPVFSTEGGSFVGRYDRDAIRDDALQDAQRDALAALDAVAAQPEHALTVALHPGDLLFYNPHLIWKRRHAGEAGTDERERQLLRLWLATPGSRALPASFAAIYGDTAAGVPRGGADGGKTMVGG